MQTYLCDLKLKYDGRQLRSHFAYQTFNIPGDSIVAFRGPCDVPRENLVDLEDAKQDKFIFSKDMLHFIVEHFDMTLTQTIAYQRLLISNVIEEIHDAKGDLRLKRVGDDIYDDVYKLSVSIATASPVSCLIHVGLNISSENTPVPTKGLEDYALNPHAVARGVMNRYRAEMEGIQKARAKVRACR